MTLIAPIDLTIRVARGHAQQQAALDAWLNTPLATRPTPGAKRTRAVIAEGALLPLTAPPEVAIERIAAGCVCCVGFTALRVTLTRLVRARRPTALLLLIAAGEHVPRVRDLLRKGELGVEFVEENGERDASE